MVTLLIHTFQQIFIHNLLCEMLACQINNNLIIFIPDAFLLLLDISALVLCWKRSEVVILVTLELIKKKKEPTPKFVLVESQEGY